MQTEKRKIVLVDDDLTDLLVGKNALSGVFDVYTVPSGEALFRLTEMFIPDMILLDVEMPDTHGYEVMKTLKADLRTTQIPVIFLTSRNDVNNELKGFELGAADYITKPFSPALLIKRIEIHLLADEQKKQLREYGAKLEEAVNQKMKVVLELENAILKTIAGLVERRDDVTGGHIERTQNYLRIFIDEILNRGLYEEETKTWDTSLLILSSQLHDVGKIAISDEVLRKPGRLTEEEFKLVKEHTRFGGKVIERIQEQASESEFLTYAKILAVCHHERWDGNGYPEGLKGINIPLQARLMSIVNVYDALVSERSYKQPFTHEESVALIARSSGTEFEPALVDLFIEIAPRFREATEAYHAKAKVLQEKGA